jgi:hypothetical protein
MSASRILVDLDKKLAEKENIQSLREDIVQLKRRKESLTNRERELREGILTGDSLIGVERGYRYCSFE